MPRTSVPSRCWAEPREYVMFEDTGNPRPIDRGSRFDCDWNVTEQAGAWGLRNGIAGEIKLAIVFCNAVREAVIQALRRE